MNPRLNQVDDSTASRYEGWKKELQAKTKAETKETKATICLSNLTLIPHSACPGTTPGGLSAAAGIYK